MQERSPLFQKFDKNTFIKDLKETGSINSLCYSPDGSKLAFGTSDGSVLVLKVEADNPFDTIWEKHYFSGIHALAFSPDGKLLAVASSEKDIKLLDAQDGNQLAKLSSHQAEVFSIAFSSDGKFLVSGDAEGEVIVWKISDVLHSGKSSGTNH